MKSIILKKSSAIAISAALCATLFTGCAGKEGAAVGTGVGAGIGALAGNLIGAASGNRALGTAIGALVGAGVGYAVGSYVDMQKAKELQQAAINSGYQATMKTKSVQVSNDANMADESKQKPQFESMQVFIKTSDVSSNKATTMIQRINTFSEDKSIKTVTISGQQSLIQKNVLPYLSSDVRAKVKIVDAPAAKTINFDASAV